MSASTRWGEMLPSTTALCGRRGWLIDGRVVWAVAGGADDDQKPGEGDPPKGDDDPPKGADGQPFDATRAQRTIDTLRDEVKAGKTAARELEAAKARLREIDDANKSETEKLAARATESAEKLTAAEARARDLAIRLAVAETASAIGIAGPSVKAAVRLLDTAALEFAEDGTPTNVEAALKALVKEYPMLAAKAEDDAGQKTGTTRAVPPTPKPNGRQPTQEQDIDKRAEILRASGAYGRF